MTGIITLLIAAIITCTGVGNAALAVPGGLGITPLFDTAL